MTTQMRTAIIITLSLVAAGLSYRDASLSYWRNQAALSYDRGTAPPGIPAWVADDPQIKATAAEANLMTGRVRPAALPAIAANAKAALRLDPLNPAAVFELGKAVEPRDAAAAANFYELAERLSRREVPNEIALEALAAVQGDVAGAITRIDRIVSVAPALRKTIFAALAPALEDQTIRGVVSRYAGRPWYSEMLSAAIEGDADPAAVEFLIRAGHAHLAEDTAAALHARLMTKVIAAGNFDAAARLFAALPAPRRSALGQIGFLRETTDPRGTPLTWRLANEPGLAVALSGADGLSISIEADQPKRASSRTTLLSPGGYVILQTLSYDARAPRAGITWDVVCAGPQPKSLWHQPIPPRQGETVTYRARLNIPSGCGAQEWRLQAIGQGGNLPSVVTLGDLSLARQP